MKRVLIVGANSYIGTSFERYVQDRLDVATVSSFDNKWRSIDYSGFDCIVYVAGIAHRKQAKKNKDTYFLVNRDLAFAVAQKAKVDGARQFIYISSMSVYGMKSGEITERTVPSPRTNDYYGLSKWRAEGLISPLQSDDFRVTIIRPPMVYGPGCPGSFQALIRIVKLSPIIPTMKNKRSMIFIDNLAELLALTIEEPVMGVICPQNSEYVCTSAMMDEIAIAFGKQRLQLPAVNVLIKLFIPICPPLQKAFGNLYYSNDTSASPLIRNNNIVGFADSIKKSIISSLV